MIELELKSQPGTEIGDACLDAKRVSQTLSIPVVFDFNGRTIYVTPNSSVNKLLEHFYYAAKNDIKVVVG